MEAYCPCIDYWHGPNSVHSKYMLGMIARSSGMACIFITFTSDPESNMKGCGLSCEFMHTEMKDIFLQGKFNLMVAVRLTIDRSGSHLVGAIGQK